MKSDIDFAADNDGNIVVTQRTVMTPKEFLIYAQQVYMFAVEMGGVPTVGLKRISAE